MLANILSVAVEERSRTTSYQYKATGNAPSGERWVEPRSSILDHSAPPGEKQPTVSGNTLDHSAPGQAASVEKHLAVNGNALYHSAVKTGSQWQCLIPLGCQGRPPVAGPQWRKTAGSQWQYIRPFGCQGRPLVVVNSWQSVAMP